MSQSGPFGSGPSSQPISGDGFSRPYTMPVDPWHDPSSTGTAPPVQPPWGTPSPAPRRRPPRSLLAVGAAMGLLIAGGLGIAVHLLTGRGAPPAPPATNVSAAAPSATRSQDVQDARFATTGQCVKNEGSDNVPRMRMAACGKGAYEVLKRVDGTTSGEKDAESKCAVVRGYTNWYFYDSELDGLDFVLCLRAR